jgi:hypothetical protein
MPRGDETQVLSRGGVARHSWSARALLLSNKQEYITYCEGDVDGHRYLQLLQLLDCVESAAKRLDVGNGNATLAGEILVQSYNLSAL